VPDEVALGQLRQKVGINYQTAFPEPVEPVNHAMLWEPLAASKSTSPLFPTIPRPVSIWCLSGSVAASVAPLCSTLRASLMYLGQHSL
jgi:hypothetical protein